MTANSDGLSWTIGAITITSVVELDVHWKLSRFLPEAKPDLVATHDWLRPYLDEDPEWFPLRMQAFVVETPTNRIIVDTCIGNDKERGYRDFNMLDTPFLANLKAAGFEPESIDTVLCTHLHVDHVGWNTMLVDNTWVPTFSNARHLFCQVEYDHWRNERDELTRSVLADSVDPVIAAGLADFVPLDHHVSEGIDLVPTLGHTPGHVSVAITSAGKSGVIIGDMAHHPVQIAAPSISSTADTDPDLAADTRRRRFAKWSDDDTLVIGSHFAAPTAGRLVPDNSAWRLT